MEYWFLMTGAAVSLAGAVFHGVVGGRLYMENINKSQMAPLTKSLSLVSWHVFTIYLFINVVALSYIAYNPGFAIAAYPLIGVNLLGAMLFIMLGIGKHRALLRMPGGYLMGAMALLAWLGV